MNIKSHVGCLVYFGIKKKNTREGSELNVNLHRTGSKKSYPKCLWK